MFSLDVSNLELIPSFLLRYHAVVVNIRPTRIKIQYNSDQTFEHIKNEDIEKRGVRLVRRSGDEENRKPKITPYTTKSASRSSRQSYTVSEKKKRTRKASPKRAFMNKRKRKSPVKQLRKRLSVSSAGSESDGSESDAEPVEFEEAPGWLLGI